MKKYLFLMMMTVMIIGSTSMVTAQNAQMIKGKQHFTQEQIVTNRTNRMVQTLMLDDATAEKFAPIYSQYIKELIDCRKVNMNANKGMYKGMNNKTDADVDKMIQNQFAQSHKILDIREKYYTKFRKIISAKQVLKIYQIEKRDQNTMKKEIQKRKNQKDRIDM
jgi:hypothetical protein